MDEYKKKICHISLFSYTKPPITNFSCFTQNILFKLTGKFGIFMAYIKELSG